MGKWLDMWIEDLQSIITTMIRNMQSDLEAGYNPNGNSILRQKAVIEEKQKFFESKMEDFKWMEPARVNQWCYIDLKKRGAID